MTRFLLFIALFIFKSTMCQFPLYFADLVKGEAWIIHPKKAPVKMSFRDFIFKEDTVKLIEGAEITLVNTGNRAIILSKKGSYSVNEIAKSYPVMSRGVTRIYFEQIWQQLKIGPSGLTEVKKLAQSLGGVSRGDNSMLVVTPVDNSIVCSDTVSLEWKPVKGSINYEFRLLDHEGKILIETKVSDTQFIVTHNFLVNNPYPDFYWEVRPTNQSCIKAAQQKWVWLSVSEYEAKVLQLIEMIPNDHTQYYFLVVAEKLVANNFFDLAAIYILKAVNFRPYFEKY